MTESEQIREIWQEMKALKRMRESGIVAYDNETYAEWDLKYSDIEILFGNESTLLKAVIYHIDRNQKNLVEKLSEIKI